jgi:beta-lactamase class A
MISRRSAAKALGAGMVVTLTGRSRASLAISPSLSAAEEAFRRIEAKTGGRLGVAVIDLETQTRAGHRGGERFPILSTFKLLACSAVLQRMDVGKETLERRIAYKADELVPHSPTTKDRVGEGMTLAQLCEATMTLSDNTAANLILKTLEGPEGLTHFLAQSVTP